MRLLATVFAALVLAAPAHAATLPATFAAPVRTDGVTASTDVATADFDGDRRPDFVTATGATVTVLDSGAPAPVTYPAAANAVTTADLDQDGHPDLVTAGASSISVLLGKAGGRSAPPPSPRSPRPRSRSTSWSASSRATPSRTCSSRRRPTT